MLNRHCIINHKGYIPIGSSSYMKRNDSRKLEGRNIKMKQEEKKKSNKKYVAFGFAMVFALALGTAMLVPYLSNTITGDVDIESPLELTGTLEGSFDRMGGETLEKTIIVTNLADATITTHSEFAITAPEAWSTDLAEFNSITISDGLGFVGDLKDATSFGIMTPGHEMCTIRAGNSKILDCVLGDVTLLPTDVVTYTLNTEFNQAIVPGTYSFSVQTFD
jgi:hypothetical protein